MFNRGETTAIYLHDGGQWRLVIMVQNHGSWSIHGSETASGSAQRLPEELLAYADARHVQRMAVLMATDIHSAIFKAPIDADPEEMQTALRYETAQNLSTDVDDVRLAAINADLYNLSSDPDTWLLAALPENRLRYFEQLAQERGVRFLGCGSFELAALGWFRHHHPGDHRLLLIKESNAFYVAPGMDEIPCVTATLPVGNQPDHDENRDHDRRQRAARQLAVHNHMPINVVKLSATTDPAHAMHLAELVPPTTATTTQYLCDILDELTSTVCHDLSRHATTLCPLVGPTPPHRDPYRAGTWLCIAIVLLTMVGIAVTWHALAQHEAALHARKQAWTRLIKAREHARDKAACLRKQRDDEIERRNALVNTPVLPPGLMSTLNTLATGMPPCTRLDYLACLDAPGCFEIRGRTHWQEGLADLLTALNNALRPSALVALQDSIASCDNNRHDVRFVYRIVPIDTKTAPTEDKP